MPEKIIEKTKENIKLNKNILSTQPYKGARDFYPEDMRIRNYMFETWKKVCRRYGLEEYDFPILENFEVFASKTGEEIVNEQLYSFEDKGGRKLAIRPELTPSTVRMIAQRYKEIPQPIKWFMIGNNWRFEKPQLGRGREFYQLECNIFGEASVTADFEIFSIIIDIMKAFGATEEMFSVRVNDRRLITALLKNTLNLDSDLQVKARRLMDKRNKMSAEEFLAALKELGVDQAAAEKIETFMKTEFTNLATVIPSQTLETNEGYKTIKQLFELLQNQNLMKYVQFDPSIIRGFDYSDGLVYEAFDKNPTNPRSMFGGERFDRLIEVFGVNGLPATGFAWGDYTFGEFIKNWNLMPKVDNPIEYFITIWPSSATTEFINKSLEIAQKLRDNGKNCLSWINTDTKIEKQLKYADKKGANYAVIIGEQELSNGTVVIKDLKTQTQETKSIDEFIATVY